MENSGQNYNIQGLRTKIPRSLMKTRALQNRECPKLGKISGKNL